MNLVQHAITLKDVRNCRHVDIGGQVVSNEWTSWSADGIPAGSASRVGGSPTASPGTSCDVVVRGLRQSCFPGGWFLVLSFAFVTFASIRPLHLHGLALLVGTNLVLIVQHIDRILARLLLKVGDPCDGIRVARALIALPFPIFCSQDPNVLHIAVALKDILQLLLGDVSGEAANKNLVARTIRHGTASFTWWALHRSQTS
mmetsp:Transcript_16971/g.35764  ORF Transcript_16971/g.35764 Transcript_16971/m.35764 type:complete len:201 (+) Transcript_16971:219-821(+)